MKPHKDQYVMVEFADHAQNMDRPPIFQTLGKILQVDRSFVLLSPWFYADKALPVDDNVDTTHILRATIKRARRLYLGPYIEL